MAQPTSRRAPGGFFASAPVSFELLAIFDSDIFITTVT